MIKKMFFIVLAFFTTMQVQSQDQDDIDSAFHELIYNMGICLSEQNTIVDAITAKHALLNLYQNVGQITQIVDLFMVVDEEIIEQNITTVEELIDYEINSQNVIAQAGIAWLQAYQDLFIIFKSLHEDDISFEIWCDDMAFFDSLADDEEPEDPDYLAFWHASCAMLNAQADFEDALKDIE